MFPCFKRVTSFLQPLNQKNSGVFVGFFEWYSDQEQRCCAEYEPSPKALSRPPICCFRNTPAHQNIDVLLSKR